MADVPSTESQHPSNGEEDGAATVPQSQTRYACYPEYENARNAARRMRTAYLKEHSSESNELRTASELRTLAMARARSKRNYKYEPVKKRVSRNTPVSNAAKHKIPKKPEANKNPRFGNAVVRTPVNCPPQTSSRRDIPSSDEPVKKRVSRKTPVSNAAKHKIPKKPEANKNPRFGNAVARTPVNCPPQTSSRQDIPSSVDDTDLLTMLLLAETEDVTVQVIEQNDGLKTPQSKRRRKSQVSATKENPADLCDSSPLLNCSPCVANNNVVQLGVKNDLIRNELFQNCALRSFSADMLLQQSEVTSVFRQKCLEMLNTLESLKEKGKRINSPDHAIKMLLPLMHDANSRYTLEASMCAQDIYTLLKSREFLSDSPINYYRCLLIREEMNRALTYPITEWTRSWIHSTFFMEQLMNHGGYKAVKDVDRRYIGK